MSNADRDGPAFEGMTFHFDKPGELIAEPDNAVAIVYAADDIYATVQWLLNPMLAGSLLFERPDPRITALEGLLRALDSLTNPDENFDSSINPGPERDELLAAYTARKDVPR